MEISCWLKITLYEHRDKITCNSEYIWATWPYFKILNHKWAKYQSNALRFNKFWLQILLTELFSE